MKFKPLSKKDTTFYVFETPTRKFSIFDEYLDLPIYVGTWNKCAAIITSIKKHLKQSQILYYTTDRNGKLSCNIQWSHIPRKKPKKL